MRCPQHPKYKGAKLGVRNKECPTCNQIFKIAQQEREDKKRQKYIYTSLTTPGYKVDLAHILAETMTLMKHGLQAERFWLESNSTPQEIKCFFFNCLKMSHLWINKNQWAANTLKGLLFINVLSKELKEDVPRIQVIEKSEEIKMDAKIMDSPNSDSMVLKPKKNVLTFLSEDNNG